MLSKEYPPNVYGGAGVHVEYLSQELARLTDVEVRCFGDQSEAGGAGGSPGVRGFTVPGGFPPREADPVLARVLETLGVDLSIAASPVQADVVHCHTWYSMMAGLWIKILYDIPLVVTIHSLEPMRPWKEEQLGRGYHLSSWMERTAVEAADAVIAVSQGTREEVLSCYDLDPARVHVIHNGIDLDLWVRTDPTRALQSHGIDVGRPYLLFVGRITRQKGILHLVRALERLRSDVPVVLCAGSPDTVEIGEETARAVAELKKVREGVHWIPGMIPRDDLIGVYSGAALFVCPSVYEPFGIINLEAMACEKPVVASCVGGIPEVVVDGETGSLVPVDLNDPPDFSPRDPERFADDLASAIDRVLEDPERAERQGRAGRDRVEELFSWKSIARRTLELYRSLT